MKLSRIAAAVTRMRAIRLGFALALGATLILCFFTLASQLAALNPQPRWITPRERYDPAYGQLRSVSQIVAQARADARSGTTLDNVHALEEVVRKRFYHGYTRYGLHENWMAWLAARTINADLDALVQPEEILAYDAAACSQQALVVQAALKEMGVTFATVRLPSHFFAAAWIDGNWYIVDPWGPVERDRSRLHKLEDLMTVAGRNRLFRTEEERRKWDTLRFSVAHLSEPDVFPAARARLFHRITGWASQWLWLPVLLLTAALRPLGKSRLARSASTQSRLKPNEMHA